MADFRRWFYALAVVALLAGLTVPASAQSTAVTCNTNSSVPTVVRSQAYADFVGDLVLSCTGGQPTAPGQVVPQVTLTIYLSTNVTSKLTSGTWDEALLLIDEPNTPSNPNRPILNCGNSGAPDTGQSGNGVCAIIAPPANGLGQPQPALTYDGTSNTYGTLGAVCGTTVTAGTYGCGRPNVFQGRQGNPSANVVVFAGVPFDPPGTLTTRTLRITNVRGDAELTGVSSSFTQAQIQMNVSFAPSTLVAVNNPQQIVAYVENGFLNGSGVVVSNGNFLQCNSENSPLFAASKNFVLGTSPLGGSSGGGGNTGGLGGFGGTAFSGSGTPIYRFQEGFTTAWKTKNVAFLLANGVPSSGGYVYGFTTNYPTDLNQNIAGANYNTESGFEYMSTLASPSPNPPNSIGTTPVPANGSLPLTNSYGGTGIASSGQATQGTRLALSFQSVPTGANIYVAPVLYLYRQSAATSTCSPSYPGNTCATLAGGVTGVMVLTSTDAFGDTAYSAVNTTAPLNLVQVSNGLVVYEILFCDPNSQEQVDVPVVVAYASQLSANPPVGYPVPGTPATVAGGFAPFYNTAAAHLASATLPVPRFVPGTASTNLFSIIKCACDILFPFVASVGGFDTGIAIANTSLDPGSAYGFTGSSPQTGSVQFWYYGTGANGGAPPASQTSGQVPPGNVLTYVLSTGGGAIGTNPNGVNGASMTNAAAGFEGYIIAQAGFQWCHGFAFISPLGGGPTSAGVSEGYLGIIVDGGGSLNRTGQNAEIRAH